MLGHCCFCRLLVGDTEAMCLESCEYSKDGVCDDGGPGSDFDDCAFGTDCEVELPSKNDLSKKTNCDVASERSPFPHSTFFLVFFHKHPIIFPLTAGLWRTLRQLNKCV